MRCDSVIGNDGLLGVMWGSSMTYYAGTAQYLYENTEETREKHVLLDTNFHVGHTRYMVCLVTVGISRAYSLGVSQLEM
jgi:hypothetical protein